MIVVGLPDKVLGLQGEGLTYSDGERVQSTLYHRYKIEVLYNYTYIITYIAEISFCLISEVNSPFCRQQQTAWPVILLISLSLPGLSLAL